MHFADRTMLVDRAVEDCKNSREGSARTREMRAREENEVKKARHMRNAHNSSSETVILFLLWVDNLGWNRNGVIKDAATVYRHFDQLWGRINYEGV